MEVINPLIEEGKSATAYNVYMLMHGMGAYAVQPIEICEQADMGKKGNRQLTLLPKQPNPVHCVQPPQRKPRKDREGRALGFDEVRWIFTEMQALTKNCKYLWEIVMIMLLTGTRANEVLGMRRDEFKRDENGKWMWIIPAERIKNVSRAKTSRKKTPTGDFVVPMCPKFVEIVAALKLRTNSDLLMPGEGDKAITERTFGKSLDRMAVRHKVPKFRSHDLRKTFLSYVRQERFQPDLKIAAKFQNYILNQVSGQTAPDSNSTTRTVADKHYDMNKYYGEKRVGLLQWFVVLRNIVLRGEAAYPEIKFAEIEAEFADLDFDLAA